MTCIVGLVGADRIYIGADSAGTDSQMGQTIRRDGKLFQNGPYLIGFSGSYRVGQLIQYAGLPEPAQNDDLPRFMVTTFIESVRQILKAGGVAQKKEEVESGGFFLVAIRGRLFNIASDYQVGESADPFDATGSGERSALGAMYAMKDATLGPTVKITTALEAAERYHAAVRRPFVIRELMT